MRTLLVTLALGLAASQSAWAVLTPVNPVGGNGSEDSLQKIINDRGNTLVTIASDADQLDDGTGPGQDGWWNGLGGESATIIVEVAGFSPNNRFGYYNAADASQTSELFSGASGAGAVVTFTPSYSTFGWYIQNTVNGNFTWYSDSALNANSLDHMVAYQGKGQTLNPPNVLWDSQSYLLGWEDQSLGDSDYQDMVVIVKNVAPVPDAGATLALLGAGLVGIGLIRRRFSA